MTTTDPTDRQPARAIPPYSEQDERAARGALERVQPRPFEPLIEQAVREVAGAIAWARTEERDRIIAELIDGSGSHDCQPCGNTGALADGRTCPLCGGYGTL